MREQRKIIRIDEDLVIAAHCAAFAVPGFHKRYLPGRAVVAACTKLDDSSDYVDCFRAMIEQAEPKRITIVQMEVPCCTVLERILIEARDRAGSDVPIEVHTVSLRGEVAPAAVSGEPSPTVIPDDTPRPSNVEPVVASQVEPEEVAR